MARIISRRQHSFFNRLSVTTTIIILNVIVFLAIFFAFVFIRLSGQGSPESFISYIALNPSIFIDGYIWTLLTSMFTHLGLSHLLLNMVSLFFIGTFVERLIGRKRYAWFYLVSGLIAGIFFVVFAYFGTFFPQGQSLFGGITDSAVGASGAIFGLGGLLAVLIPRLRVLVFFIVPMPLWAAMSVLLVGFWIISVIAGLPIGNTAHFGGLLVGLIYGFYLRTKYARKVALLNRMFA